MIPPRPKYPLRTNSAEKAVQDYHGQVKSIVNSILEDYRALKLGENDVVIDGSNEEVALATKENEFEER